ncbi:MAG TPA: hypothetical protein ENJ11_10490, partial [Gammaproteobacteria bacterium]|nr:hypothetical protein [Gammaproteobacteria bacterium]
MKTNIDHLRRQGLRVIGFAAISGFLIFSATACSDSGTTSATTVPGIAASKNKSDDDHSKDSATTFKIKEAKWESGDNKLEVKGKGTEDETVTVSNAATGGVIGDDKVDDDDKWKVKARHLASVPCRIRAEQSDGQSAEMDVKDAPADCDDGNNGGNNQPPVANDNAYGVVKNTTLSIAAPGVLGNDTDDGKLQPLTASLVSDVSHGSLTLNPDGSFEYTPDTDFTGSDSFSYAANDGEFSRNASVSITVSDTPVAPATSINSTSQNGPLQNSPVPEMPAIGLIDYSVFAVNDLGMHCGDFDTRISSILPPFNVLHAQVIQKGAEPKILDEATGTRLTYTASANPNDPILGGTSPSGQPLLSSLTKGNVYKTNFWDLAMGSNESIALKAYRPFYPPGILDAFSPVADQGLPMPDVERLYLGDGVLAADQQSMPGILDPYIVNDGQHFGQYVSDLPFFINFPFGYTVKKVNWFEAAGVPVAAFDDAGRENPYPLFRVQAHDAGGTLLASVDTVAPISGEANCKGCHGAPVDGGNGSATKDLTDVATTLDDPQLGDIPLEVSKEYAADINILRLHDQKHGTMLEGSTPVVCQSCHYTPALDLAHVGPRGPENDTAPGDPSNGRDQVVNKSMSNVMHSHHATVTDQDGKPLFPSMPPPVDANGKFRDPLAADDILQQTCYQCHPGRRTNCLRGAMASGGMLCQDCHGDMAQVGNDFSRNVSKDNPGAFELADDFYTNPNTPRVPWANEPGCGACHTGDAMDNLAGAADTIAQPDDGIRLMQAWRIGDAKATPIVPSNKRFAEPVVAATGNPQLYRVSTGHEGVLCESCHGATHAIFPNANPNANDNVASMQLQGHAGVISECSTCHTGDMGITLDGPHGMHPVGDAGNDFADGGHEDIA